MKLSLLLKNTPRLLDWYNIGPVQRAELEDFASLILMSWAKGVTLDGYLVEDSDPVWFLAKRSDIKVLLVSQLLDNPYEAIPISQSFYERKNCENYYNEQLRKVQSPPPSQELSSIPNA